MGRAALSGRCGSNGLGRDWSSSGTVGDGRPNRERCAWRVVNGNGEWTCRIRSEWGKLPPGTTFGGTHGAIAQDNAGHIYVSTQSTTGVLV